jgi:PTS system ascorbate-specific IIB component
MATSKRIDILTVCGVGSGSSLILRMYVEDVLEEFGIRYRVQAGQVSEAKGSRADIILCSHEFLSVTKGATARVIPIKNFTDKKELRESLKPVLTELGFMAAE